MKKIRRNTVVLSAHPLSAPYRAKLEDLYPDGLIYVDLRVMRQKPMLSAMRELTSINSSKLVIPIEVETSRPILPILIILGALTRCRRIVEVNEYLREKTHSRWAAGKEAVALIWQSIVGQTTMRRNVRLARRLLLERRVKIDQPSLRKMLYINSSLWYGARAGGSVGHISGVVNAFLGREVDVDFASLGGGLMTRDGVNLIPLAAPSTYAFPYEINSHLFSDVVTKILSQHYDNNEKPSVIYQRLTVANFSGVILSRRWGIPYILEYNGSEAWASENWGRRLRYESGVLAEEEACIRHAHLIVTVSDALRDELIARGVEPKRIVNYPNCIDPTIFDPTRLSTSDRLELRTSLGIKTDATVVMFLGTFGHWHGASVLAKAIRQLVSDDPSWCQRNSVHFLFVGDGLKLPEVREILRPINRLDELCTFTGLVPQPESHRYLAISDIVVSPHVPNPDGTRFFGSPTKLFEYMAMAKAIVASDLDQIGQILQPSIHAEATGEETGAEVAVLSRPGDVESLSAGIRLLVDRADLREILGRNARALALSRYTWDQHVEKIVQGLADIRH